MNLPSRAAFLSSLGQDQWMAYEESCQLAAFIEISAKEECFHCGNCIPLGTCHSGEIICYLGKIGKSVLTQAFCHICRGSFWSRVWPRSCGVDRRPTLFERAELNADSSVSDTNFDSLGSPPPLVLTFARWITMHANSAVNKG